MNFGNRGFTLNQNGTRQGRRPPQGGKPCGHQGIRASGGRTGGNRHRGTGFLQAPAPPLRPPG
jgi:hypothetical protein